MRRRTLLVGLGVAAAAAAASAGWAKDRRSEALRAAAEGLRAQASVPAMGVGVVDSGRTVFLGGFGEIGGRPATAHDRFRAASISKLLCAQATMQLVEAGKLALDDDVSRWVPAFQGRGITLRLLLTHRAGLRDQIFPLERDGPERVEDYLDRLEKVPFDAPGEAFRYADAGFNLLGAAIAKASGRTYPELIQQRILRPLDLKETSAFPDPAQRTGVAEGFMNKPEVKLAARRPYDIAYAPSEGLLTSAHDLTAWMGATLRRDARLMSAPSFDAMITPQAEADGPNRRVGLAWQLREEGGRKIAEHGGSVRGYNALVLTYPAEGRGFAILTNADDAPRWEIARALDEVLSR